MKKIISNKILREFGLLISFVFPILIGWILPAFRGHSFSFWTLWISLPALILALISPSLLFYPYKAWMKLGYILGWINSRIILGMVYFIVLLPISLLMRVFGHDPLRLKKSNLKSYKEDKLDHKINLKKIF